MSLNTLIIIVVTYFGAVTSAQSSILSGRPGFIPLPAIGAQAVATDLLGEDGSNLTRKKIIEIRQQEKASKKRYEWWKLNPAPSDIWRGQVTGTSLPPAVTEADQKLPFAGYEEVTYATGKISRSKIFRFGAYKNNDPAHKGIAYTFVMYKRQHNFLLLKGLLRKMGYHVPGMKRLPQLKVHFNSITQKELFISEIKRQTQGEPKRWVVDDSEDKSILLQDVLVVADTLIQKNLAMGYLPAGQMGGKRIYKSLLLPFAFTENPESVNLLEWLTGRIVSNHIKLEHRSASEFAANYDDTKWAAQRILQLERADFEEIVAAADLPYEVSLLLIEKLISRRNSLIDLYQLHSFHKIQIDSEISSGERLQAGKLYGEWWDGYSARFSYGDPNSPLSNTELWAFGRSKFYSNAIANLVSEFNTRYIPTADLGTAIAEHNFENFLKDLQHLLETGEPRKTPFAVWTTPTWGGNLIAARDIVTGLYLGTDNLVQLADTIGWSLYGGLYLGFDGLPVKAFASGSATLSWTRTYTHLRPITSVKKALKYPFKNILVPKFKKDIAKILDDLSVDRLAELDTKNRIKVIDANLSDLKRNLTNFCSEMNESFYLEVVDNLRPTLREIIIEGIIPAWTEEYHPKSPYQDKDFNAFIATKIVMDTVYGPVAENCLESVERENEAGEIIVIKATAPIDIAKDEISKLMVVDYRQAKIIEIVNIFRDELTVGESIIVSDSFGPNLNINLAYDVTNLWDILNLYAQFQAGRNTISRLHIHRYSEDEIHIYRDQGNVGSINVSIGLSAKIQILDLTVYHRKKGTATTKFYELDINPNKNENPNIIENGMALREVLLNNDTEMAEAVSPPYILKHKFTEKKPFMSSWRFFHWQRDRFKTRDHITVTAPTGDEKLLYRRIDAKRTGKNYEALGIDVLNALLDKFVEYDLNISNAGSGRPDYTIHGSSKTRTVLYDAEISVMPDIDYIMSQLAEDLIDYCGAGYTAQIKNELEEFGNDLSEVEKTSKKKYFEPTIKDFMDDELPELCPKDLGDDSKRELSRHHSRLRGIVWGYRRRIHKSVRNDRKAKGDRVNFEESFVKINYTWRGWKISRKKAEKIIKEINQMNWFEEKDLDELVQPDPEIYHPLVLATTKNILLYTIIVDFNVYEKGIEHMLGLNEGQVRYIYQNYLHRSQGKRNVANYVERFMHWQEWAKRRREQGNLDKYTQDVIELVSRAEDQLSIEGLTYLFGGRKNLFVNSSIRGFKEGHENGDQAFFGNSIGEFGSSKVAGPVAYIRDKVGMTEGEFLIYWMLERP